MTNLYTSQSVVEMLQQHSSQKKKKYLWAPGSGIPGCVLDQLHYRFRVTVFVHLKKLKHRKMFRPGTYIYIYIDRVCACSSER